MQNKLSISLVFAAGITIAVSTPSPAQTREEQTNFPTYQQIKPKNREIIDQVPRNSPASLRTQINNAIRLNLFDYPAGTVTYYLNDQPTTDSKYVKEVLNNKSISVETIVIEAPNEAGKRTIKIKYVAL